MAKLFVALWPPVEVIEQLAVAALPPQPGARWEEPERLHITLRFLGAAAIEAVTARLDRIELPAASAVIEPRSELLGPSAIVLPVAGLDELARVVAAATADLGDRAPKPFVGHLTLGRLQRRSGTVPLPAGLRPAGFEVESVALVASAPTAGRSRYDTVAEWPTVGPARP